MTTVKVYVFGFGTQAGGDRIREYLQQVGFTVVLSVDPVCVETATAAVDELACGVDAISTTVREICPEAWVHCYPDHVRFEWDETPRATDRLPLPVLSCDDCGLCCHEQGGLPVTYYLHLYPELPLPDSLRQELQSLFDSWKAMDNWPTDESECVWFDPATKRCKHHVFRPAVCRDFLVGGPACLRIRREWGLAVEPEVVEPQPAGENPSVTDPDLTKLTAPETLILFSLYNDQGTSQDALPIDRLPGTANIRWMVEKMNRKFGGRKWTEELVYAYLVALREGGLFDDLE